MGIFKNTYQEQILHHYEKQWKNNGKMYLWDRGNFEKLPYDFRVLEFAPNNIRNMWTYATCAMSQPDDEQRIELHLFSSKKDEGLIEILTTIAYYHRNTAKIGLGHTLNFGRPWQDKSLCEYGFVSLPYLDGPSLENLENGRGLIKFYWLVPVTKNEVDFKGKNGVEELECKFDDTGLDYINPNRSSII